MYLYGSFINQQGETISLQILTKGDRSTSLEIGTDEAGIYFTDDPIELQSSVNDTFDVLLPQTASIHLLTANYQPELFCTNCREAVVNIFRDGQCLFAGYVEPMAYSQDYNETLDELELSCIDALSALQYSNYRDIGAASVNYATIKQSATQRTFRDLIVELIQNVGSSLDIQNGGTPSIFYDGSRQLHAQYAIFDEIAISELTFLGDEEDDVWTQEDVLTELLRYLNLHISQEGFLFRIFSWQTVKSTDEATWREITDGTAIATTQPETIDIVTHIAADCNTQISIDETFNQLQLTCDIQSVDNLIESPLDDDDLEPAFDNYQKYLTEYGSKSILDFMGIVLEQEIKFDDDSTYIRDWFAQIMRNTQWQFLSKGTDFYKAFCSTGENQQKALSQLYSFYGAAIVKWGNIEYTKDNKKDNSPVSSISTTNYLVIPVGGGTNSLKMDSYPDEDMLKNGVPRAVYNGAVSGGVFSPADENTTNYIVISGKIFLAPILNLTKPYSLLNPFVESRWIDLPTVKYKEGEKRYYTHQYFKATHPNDDEEYDENTSRGLLPPVDDGWQQYKFKYSAIEDSTDTISKVSVLACMLVIGDKCLVETGTVGQPSDFKWLEYKTLEQCADEDEYYSQCFFIGFDPKIGDYLIGTTFDIQNNINYKMGIDAEGMAIPIKKSDALSGRVEFKILGPVNVWWDDITRRHKTWFRSAKYTSTAVPLMPHVSSIYIENFEMKLYSDNGFMSDMGDNDLVYISDTDETYINKKDDLSFKIASALTTEERTALGVSDSIALNTPTDVSSNTALLSIYDTYQKTAAKPEQLYVDAYYQEYHTPHVLMTQSIIESRATASRFNHYRHPAIGKTFFVQGIDRNLMEGTATLNLKEL